MNYFSFFYPEKDSLKQICPVSGECMLFGREEKTFTEWFSDITKTPITSIRAIGDVSNNGFVRELKRSVDGYDSYVVLKSNLDRTSDNLYYEWMVGKYLNGFMKRFPLFVKTYGVYQYAEGDKQLMQENHAIPVLARLQKATIEDSIENPENICIVVQQVHEAIPFSKLIDLPPTEELKHEILCILYQVYFVLPLIPGFSHNDLHNNNVLLTPAKGKYYQYVYTKNGIPFSFQCRYAAKIIDYGRCVYTEFPGNKEEQINAGYPWKHVDTPCKESDLKLILFCIKYGVLPPTFLYDIQSSPSWNTEDVLCDNSIAVMDTPLYANYIKNNKYPDINQVANQLQKLIQPRTYGLTPACTIHVSDVADMRVDWPQRAGTRRKRKSRKSRR